MQMEHRRKLNDDPFQDYRCNFGKFTPAILNCLQDLIGAPPMALPGVADDENLESGRSLWGRNGVISNSFQRVWAIIELLVGLVNERLLPGEERLALPFTLCSNSGGLRYPSVQSQCLSGYASALGTGMHGQCTGHDAGASHAVQHRPQAQYDDSVYIHSPTHHQDVISYGDAHGQEVELLGDLPPMAGFASVPSSSESSSLNLAHAEKLLDPLQKKTSIPLGKK